MVDQFTVKSPDGLARLELSGEIPRVPAPYEGVTFYARLVSAALTASVRVYEVQPQHWSAYFRDLADHWRGWQGIKAHESLEGHLRVQASADSLGHILLTVRLRGIEVGDEWQAEDSVYLEAGQLDEVANRAKGYFG
jgi:hypothetical protein